MADDLCNDSAIKIPPFRDAHMHFMLDGRPLTLSELSVIKNAYVTRGIFSLNDMGHRSGIGLRAKALFHPGVEVRSAGYALYKKGTYGSFLGKGVSGTSEIRKAVREIAGAGADFLKVINSGIVSAQQAELVTDGGFSPEELHALNETARSRDSTWRHSRNSSLRSCRR